MRRPDCHFANCFCEEKSLPTQDHCLYQLALSVRYSSAHAWLIAELDNGYFALYNSARELQLITQNPAELIAAYLDRPPYVPPAPRSSPKVNVPKGLLDQLNITI